MKIQINFMFFVLLVCLSLALLYSAWSYHLAKGIIERNSEYEVSRETERDFNKWDLERHFRFSLAFGVMFFCLTLIYLFFCISIYDRESSNKTKKIRGVKND